MRIGMGQFRKRLYANHFRKVCRFGAAQMGCLNKLTFA